MQCQANYPHLKVLNDSHEVGYRRTFMSLFPASHQIKLEVKMEWLTDHRDYVTLSQWSAVHAALQVIFTVNFKDIGW